MPRQYKRPAFPSVKSKAAIDIARRMEAEHAALSKNININPVAIPSHLATRLTLAVSDATNRINALEKEKRDLRAQREKTWTTPRVPQLDQLFALNAFSAFAASQKDPAKVWKDLLYKKEPTPYDRSLIQAAIELNLPVAGDVTPMLFNQKRRELGLPDSVAEEMEKLAEQEQEKGREIAELRSVVLAGVSGASLPELSGILPTELSEEQRAAYREDGKESMDAAIAYNAMLRAAMVADGEGEAVPIPNADTPAFSFHPVAA